MSSTRSRGRRRRGGHHAEEHENEERWLLTYADMITLMMALFIVLFAMSSVNITKLESLQSTLQDAFSGKILSGGKAVIHSGSSEAAEKQPPQPPLPAMMPPDAVNRTRPGQDGQRQAEAAKREDEDFRRLKQRIDQLAAAAGLEGRVSTEIRRRGLVVRLITDDVFFDSGQARLKHGSLAVLSKIGHVIRDERHHPVVVEGYTDAQPIATAQFPSNWELSGARAAAVVRRLGAAGIHSQRMSLSGYAHQHPIDTNSTSQGRARNRRVEIVLARLNQQ